MERNSMLTTLQLLTLLLNFSIPLLATSIICHFCNNILLTIFHIRFREQMMTKSFEDFFATQNVILMIFYYLYLNKAIIKPSHGSSDGSMFASQLKDCGFKSRWILWDVALNVTRMDGYAVAINNYEHCI